MGTETEVKLPEATDEANSTSKLEQRIIRQIEHYFGNFNLSKDKFLKEQITLDEGWVPLETMVKFNRLKSLSEDFDVISAALKKSTNELMEVNEDNTKIRRRADKPLPENYGKEGQESRTLYVKGFKKTTNLDQLLDYFREYNAEYICMRRVKTNSKIFKGSCFITFQSVEDAEKFLALKVVKFEEIELLREKKKDYIARKDIFYQNIRAEKEQKAAKRAKSGGTEDSEEKAKKPRHDSKIPELTIIPGCLLKVTGLGEKSTREDLWEKLNQYGNIAYTDYSRGIPAAVIRFESGVAAKVLDDATEDDGKKIMEFGGVKASVEVLEGDVEANYWKSIRESKVNSRALLKQNKGRFKKKPWGKRRKESNYDEQRSEPPSKKLKIESQGDDKPSVKPEIHDNDKPSVKPEIHDSDKPSVKPEIQDNDKPSVKSEATENGSSVVKVES